MSLFCVGNEVDQIFSILCQELKSEIKSLDDLFDKLKNAPIIPQPDVEHFLFSWDWKSFIVNNLTDKNLENHSFYHSFKFTKDDKTVLMRAKHLPQDTEWIPASGIRLIKEDIEFDPVCASEFRIDKLNLPKIFSDLLKYYQRLPMQMKVKVSTNWDVLRDTLEGLPAKRMNLAKMKISELKKQGLSGQPSIPEQFQHVVEREVPELIGDIFPESLDEGDFDKEVVVGLDVVCYTKSRVQRPWIGKVVKVLPEQKFVINWYARRRGNQNMFYAMEENGKPYCSVQENACVILWGISVNQSSDSFFVSNFSLSQIKNEYLNYDKNEV